MRSPLACCRSGSTYSCASISTRIATAYDTLGFTGLTHSLSEPSCATLFNATLLPAVLAVLPAMPSVKSVLFDGDVDAKLVTKLRDVRGDVQVFSVAELREHGQKLRATAVEEEVARRRPGKEAVSCIMYTSGSTGVCGHHACERRRFRQRRIDFPVLTTLLALVFPMLTALSEAGPAAVVGNRMPLLNMLLTKFSTHARSLCSTCTRCTPTRSPPCCWH
ncbi:hypothetical protein C8R45DRAFT_1115509 [Mycena sanguinolenta]|nr:hypothetical protein C8R45DRAFT_1115868 [Mycena sanguinolenta]KAJ6447728.1 hypothetical protein C8R45DRAFT_1115742 [Mycena sanguinolenta]KAJ6448123.1 hypothetical protein C8R45DRAFT_1115509 [Mycena sanguinolenta]